MLTRILVYDDHCDYEEIHFGRLSTIFCREAILRSNVGCEKNCLYNNKEKVVDYRGLLNDNKCIILEVI